MLLTLIRIPSRYKFNELEGIHKEDYRFQTVCVASRIRNCGENGYLGNLNYFD